MQQKQQLEDLELDIFHELAETALAKGCVRARQPGSYHLINLALRPFQTSIRFFQYFNQLEYIWHTLFLKVSNDESVLEQILSLGSECDEWMSFLQKIYRQSKNNKHKDSITFCRCDYLLQGEQPKIVQYNLMTVGMSYANRLMTETHKRVFSQQKDLYFQNDATSYLIDAIKFHYTSRKLQGLFIFIISSSEFITIFQQKYIEEQLISLGIKCKRVKLKDLLQHGKKDEQNNLFYKGQLVSFAYYFTGYNLKQYDEIGTREDAINAKLLLTTSNVTCVPSIQMMIINTKCGQAYLAKPEVLRKHLNQQQIQTLQKTFVQNYVLSDLNQSQYDRLIARVQTKPQEWILKPNMEGGGNNIFGSQIIKPLSELKKQDRGKYSIMKKIGNNPYFDNYIILKGMELQKVRCTYEIGRYGLISTIGGNLVQNISGGSLIRSKQIDKQCSYIDYGNDGLVAWKMSHTSSL